MSSSHDSGTRPPPPPPSPPLNTPAAGETARGQAPRGTFLPVFHAGTAAAVRGGNLPAWPERRGPEQQAPGWQRLPVGKWNPTLHGAAGLSGRCAWCLRSHWRPLTSSWGSRHPGGSCSLEHSARQWRGAAAGGGPHRGRDRRQDCGDGGTPRPCCLLQPAAKASSGVLLCLLRGCWPCMAGALVDSSSRPSCGCLVVPLHITPGSVDLTM